MNCRRLISIVVLIASGMSLFSCDAERPAYNRENLKATWLVNVYDNDTVNEYNWMIYQFDDKQTVTLSGIATDLDGNRKWKSSGISYEAYCCDMSMNGNLNGLFDIPTTFKFYQKFSFINSQDSSCVLELMESKLNGEVVAKTYNRMTMIKLRKDYNSPDSLLGIWQTNMRDGEPFDICRLQFEKNNKLTFKVQSAEGDWVATGNGNDTYYLYDDFAVLNLYDNEYLGTPGLFDVACLKELDARPKLSLMSFKCNGHSFLCTFVASI